MFVQIVDTNDNLVLDTNRSHELIETFNPRMHTLLIEDGDTNYGDEYELVAKLMDKGQLEAVMAALEVNNSISTIQEAYDYFQCSYRGYHNSDELFTQYIVDTHYCLPEYLVVNWYETSKEVIKDYKEHGGHYFKR